MESSLGLARKNNSTHYFTGKPCKHGHIANRLSSNGTCVECMRLKGQSDRDKRIKYEWNRTEQARAGAKAWYLQA